MSITIRISDENVVVEADGTELAAFDYTDGNLRDAVSQAEAFRRGVEKGLGLAKTLPTSDVIEGEATPQGLLSLYTWDSEAVGDEEHPWTFAMVAPDEETARSRILKLAENYLIYRIMPVDLDKLDEDVAKPPVINPNEPFVFVSD